MGSGAARTTTETAKTDRVLDPELSARLGAALQRVDGLDPDFKSNRDDTRMMQRVMAWNALCKEVDAHLRTAGNVLYDAHQLSLDIGVEGAGQGTRPYVEETGGKFERLYFRLDEGDVRAVVGKRDLGAVPLNALTYEWVEARVVDWAIGFAEHRK